MRRHVHYNLPIRSSLSKLIVAFLVRIEPCLLQKYQLPPLEGFFVLHNTLMFLPFAQRARQLSSNL